MVPPTIAGSAIVGNWPVYICPSVKRPDSGPGVSPEHAERIFDPFFTTKEPGKGTGLGLAIVARVVENLDGIVWVDRAREGGAAFHLLFPLAEASFALDDPMVIPREWRA